MSLTQKQWKGLALAFGVGIFVYTYHAELFPGRHERLTKYESRDEAIGAAGKSIVTQYSGKNFTDWKLCAVSKSAGPTNKNKDRFLLIAGAKDGSANGYVNLREIKGGWRVRTQYVQHDYLSDKCEVLDTEKVAALVEKAD